MKPLVKTAMLAAAAAAMILPAESPLALCGNGPWPCIGAGCNHDGVCASYGSGGSVVLESVSSCSDCPATKPGCVADGVCQNSKNLNGTLIIETASSCSDCPATATGCNNDGVCSSTYNSVGTLVTEDPTSCPSDCPCAHNTCVQGAAMSMACAAHNYSVNMVCHHDPYCCTWGWDVACVIANSKCTYDPYCCEVEWDEQCEMEDAYGTCTQN